MTIGQDMMGTAPQDAREVPSPVRESGSADDARKDKVATRILLVEDDPSSQDLIRALCEGRGDQVDVAADGFLGLRLLSERRHDVVLIDYHLPEMDGYALARLMREITRPEGRLRLVGITADGHGLASRRGADTLFDAILVKPLDPSLLFATLDRLTQLEPEPEVADPADALWRRRGLSGRPKAWLCPPLPAAQLEALSQAFCLVDDAGDADIVLVADEAGLAALRDLRAAGTAGLLPSVALDARLGPACDLVFQVGDPDSWTALAETRDSFAGRRADLRPEFRDPRDAASRLLALLAVADRGILMSADRGSGTLAYETGQSPAAQMAAVLALAEEKKLVCEPSSDGVAVRLTDSGRSSVLREGLTERQAAMSASEPAPIRAQDRMAASRAAPMSLGWQSPIVIEAVRFTVPNQAGMPGAREPNDLPIVDTHKVQELHALLGADQILGLEARLIATLQIGFEPHDDPVTLARRAHVLVSMAGSLGFARLSERCRALETAIAAGRDIGTLLNRVERDRIDVLETLARL